MVRSTYVVVASLATTIILAACGDSLPSSIGTCTAAACVTPQAPPKVVDTVDARARWVANRPDSYEFVMTRSCLCSADFMRPVLVVVSGMTVTGRTRIDDGSPLPAEWDTSFPSIDGLFDLMDDARMRHYAAVNAVYDTVAGYPTSVLLDYQANVADDESHYAVSAFRKR